jgi:hypothetical protein
MCKRPENKIQQTRHGGITITYQAHMLFPLPKSVASQQGPFVSRTAQKDCPGFCRFPLPLELTSPHPLHWNESSSTTSIVWSM